MSADTTWVVVRDPQSREVVVSCIQGNEPTVEDTIWRTRTNRTTRRFESFAVALVYAHAQNFVDPAEYNVQVIED